MSRLGLSHVAMVVVLAILAAGCSRNDPAKYVASAETYLAKGNYAAAVIELKNALSAAPDDAKARFLLGSALLKGGDAGGAMTEFRKALALKHSPEEVYPLLARAWWLQGAPRAELAEFTNAPVQSAHAKAEIATLVANAYLGFGQRKEARASIDEALALEPSNIAARTAQARLSAMEKDLTGALRQTDAVLATAPDDLDALTLKSELQIALGKRADAAATLERTVAIHPVALFARYLLASTYVQLKEFEKAATQVAELQKYAPKDARTLYAVGLVAYSRGETETANDAVQRSLQAAPDFLPARYLSGLVDLRRGVYSSAEQSLRTVVQQSPDDSGAALALAQALLRQGQALKAREIVDKVVLKQPDDVNALRVAAEVEIALKRPDRAVALTERANSLEAGNTSGRVRLAQFRLAQGRSAEGLRDLERLAASDTEKQEADIALIQAHMRARDYEKALAAADALVKKHPQSASAHNTKGSVYAAKSDINNARLSYEKALALDPNFAPAILNLANLDGIERKYSDARKRFEQVLAKDPKSERALLGLMQVLIASGAPSQEVVAALDRAVAANPTSVPARQAVITYYLGQKNWKAAISAGQAAQAAVPDSPAILDALGSAQIKGGERNQALETFTRLAKLQPGNPVPLMRIAAIHASLKNYDEAIAALKNSMSIAPSNPPVWIALAAAYVEANKADAGFAEARRLQKDLPTRTVGYTLEAELLAAQKKVPEAIAAYRAALNRESIPFVMVRLHTMLVQTGKADEAEALAQKWLKDHPKDVTALTHLGQQSLAKDDFRQAANYYRAASELQPENLTVINDLAWALAESNDPQAIDYAQRAYRIAPTNPSVVNTLGWALFKRGDVTQGIQMLRQAVDLDPADANRRLYLARALIKGGDKSGARKELEIVAKADSASARTQAEQLLKDL